MASTTSVTLELTNSTSFQSSSPKSSHSEETTISTPVGIGLILETGILALAFGNLLVLLSLRFQKHWIITDFLLLSLSTADFVGGSFPLQLIIFMNYFLQKKWTSFLCGLYIMVVNSLRFASAGTVTLIAIERAFMILSPLKYHTTITISRIKKAVVFTWLSAVFFASLPFMGVGKSGYEYGSCFYHLTDLGETYAIIILAVSFVLLTTVLACCVAIKLSSTRFIRRQTQMDSKNKLAGYEVSRRSVTDVQRIEPCRVRQKGNPSGVREIRRLSCMMALVVSLYYISWLPILVNNIVTMVTDRRPSKLVVLITGMVSLIYAVANPFIYGSMSMRYRWAYRRVFGVACRLCGREERSWSFSFSSISTTRSRTLTNPQMSSDRASSESKVKGEASTSGNQRTEHEHVEDTAAAQWPQMTSLGTIADFSS